MNQLQIKTFKYISESEFRIRIKINKKINRKLSLDKIYYFSKCQIMNKNMG